MGETQFHGDYIMDFGDPLPRPEPQDDRTSEVDASDDRSTGGSIGY